MALAGSGRSFCTSGLQYGGFRMVSKPATGRWSADPEIPTETLRIERREDSEKANCF
jgi:hypothetical protein